MGTAIDRAAEAVQQGGVRAALAANAAVLSAQAQLDNVRLQSELAFAEHASALAAADTSLDGHVADRLTAATFLRRVQTANRAAEQARSAAANAPATRAAAWRAKSTDSRKGLKEYFEEAEEVRLLDALQRALDYAAIAAAFIPGFGWAISIGIELGNAGISVYRGNLIDAGARAVFTVAGPLAAKGATKVLGAAGRGILSVGRKAAASRAGQFVAGGVRLACRGFSAVGRGAREAWERLIQGTVKNHGALRHQARIWQEASRMASSGKYKAVYVNKWLSTITGGRVTFPRRPDVAGVLKRSGKIDIIEVRSPRQTERMLRNKLRDMQKALGELAGTIFKVVEP